MTKQFAKWAQKQNIEHEELCKALDETINGNFEASLGGNIFKKRIKFKDKGKSGSGRTIICYKREDRIIFVHGFSKNEKENLTDKELVAFKELSKALLGLNSQQIETAIKSGALIEVQR